ncbi:MAG: hypothetical protein D6713_04405 [Deltaproteobacteria bacterium]|nr:MAG: hypothetical protein D6713_04405 [Deltaproteobacteria bacterium]
MSRRRGIPVPVLFLFLSLFFVFFFAASGPVHAQESLLPQGITPEMMKNLPPGALDYIQKHPEILQKSPAEIRKILEGRGEKGPEGRKEGKAPAKEEAVKKAGEKEKEPSPPEKVLPFWEKNPYIAKLFLGRLVRQEMKRLVYFGHDIFRREKGKFEPLATLPISPDYVVGPGDEILISLWGRIEGQYPVTVDREGKIYVPKFGTLYVAGKTYRELKKFISDRVSVVTGASVDVTITRLKGIKVFILGEVVSPGAYNVSSLHTAIQALYTAGGIKDTGSLRKVQVKREGRPVVTIDLYEMLLKGDTSGDVKLLQGDTVFVPVVKKLVALAGEVRREGVYELKEGEGLLDLLKMAGGVSPTGYKKQVQVERLEGNIARIVLDVNLEELEARGENFPLMDGDIVRVKPIFYEDVNVVYLEGNVANPGKYQFHEGMRLSDLLPDESAFRPETYFDYGTVIRLVPPDLHREIIPVDFRKAILEKEEGADILLQPWDRVIVYSKTAFKDLPRATISGEVRKPGTYEVYDGMRVSDLIKLGGDLKKTAYLEKGEIVRILPDRTLKTIYFNVARAMEEDPEEDVLIEDEDRVFIHSIYETKLRKKVYVSGDVRNPGEYDLTVGMRVSDLIFKAGGLLESAYLKDAELLRYTVVEGGEETKTQTLHVSLEDALAGREDPLLQHRDHLVVKRIPDYEEKIFVTISGEVRFPGTYGVRKGERLSSLIERAGGFTEEAYLKGAVFTRESIRKVQQERIDKLIEELEHRIAVQESGELVGIIDPEDVKVQEQLLRARRALVEKLKRVKAKGRLVISLKPLEELKGSASDITLEDGDVLYVPKLMNVVNVVGEVYNPTAVTFDPDKRRAGYYLDLVGGPTDNADESQIFVVKADGTVVSENTVGDIRDVKLEPGDTIAVPEKIVKRRLMKDIKDITQILYQIAVTAGVLIVTF